MKRFLVDSRHSNAHTTWKDMGAPQNPTVEQLAKLKKAGRPDLVDERVLSSDEAGVLSVEMELAAHSVCLINLVPE